MAHGLHVLAASAGSYSFELALRRSISTCAFLAFSLERREDRPEVVIRSRFTVGLLISALNVLGMAFNMMQPNNLTTSMHVA